MLTDHTVVDRVGVRPLKIVVPDPILLVVVLAVIFFGVPAARDRQPIATRQALAIGVVTLMYPHQALAVAFISVLKIPPFVIVLLVERFLLRSLRLISTRAHPLHGQVQTLTVFRYAP